MKKSLLFEFLNDRLLTYKVIDTLLTNVKAELTFKKSATYIL